MILVTGGTGLVGAHLLFDLLRSGKNTRAIHRKNSDRKAVQKVFSYYTTAEEARKLYNKIEWAEADINDIPALSAAFHGVDLVYHCAALISFKPGDDNKLRKTNITGTANVVNLCIAKGVKKLCYVSSVASLGKPLKGEPITEKTTWNPEDNNSDYAISKYGAEIEVWRGSQEGVPVVIINPGIIIGPGFWHSGSGLIFKKIDKGFRYHFPKISGFVGVKDVVRIMQDLMISDVSNQRFILVAENVSFKKILTMTADSLGKKRPNKALKKWMIKTAYIFQKAGRLFGADQQLTRYSSEELFRNSSYSNEKVKEKLGIKFTPIAETVRETGMLYRKKN